MLIYVEFLPRISQTGSETTYLIEIIEILTSALINGIRYTLFLLEWKTHTFIPPGWLNICNILLS